MVNPAATIRARNPERLSAWILAGIAAAEGPWVVINLAQNPGGFLRYIGFAPNQMKTLAGWLLAALVTGCFVWWSAHLPSVRANLLRPSFLKLLALAVAITAGILEEVVFRKWLMDYLYGDGFGVVFQILASGLAFGLAHGIWGLMGRSLRTAVNAVGATGALGLALGVVYIIAGRSLPPCIAAHFLINALIEPGLVLAATRERWAPRVGNATGCSLSAKRRSSATNANAARLPQSSRLIADFFSLPHADPMSISMLIASA